MICPQIGFITFLIFFCSFLNPNYFFQSELDVLYLINFEEWVKEAFCFKKFSDWSFTVWMNCFSYLNMFTNSRLFNLKNVFLIITTADYGHQWRHKSKVSEKLGQCGRRNMLRPYLEIWEWDWILGRAVKDTSSLGVRSPWLQ